MTDARRHGSELDRDVLRALREPVATPDLTRPIMGRLGYMRASSVAMKRARRRRAIRRVALCTVALGALAVGVQLHNQSPDIRTPDAITIPSAIRNDLGRQQQRIDRVWNTFRGLAPRGAGVNQPSGSSPADDAAPVETAPQMIEHDDVRVALVRVA